MFYIYLYLKENLHDLDHVFYGVDEYTVAMDDNDLDKDGYYGRPDEPLKRIASRMKTTLYNNLGKFKKVYTIKTEDKKFIYVYKKTRKRNTLFEKN